MTYIRCTSKLLKVMGGSPPAGNAEPHEDDWYANLLWLDGRTAELPGVVLGEGFSPRIADAFLTVLAEDARFRALPIVVGGSFAGTAGLHPCVSPASLPGDEGVSPTRGRRMKRGARPSRKEPHHLAMSCVQPPLTPSVASAPA